MLSEAFGACFGKLHFSGHIFNPGSLTTPSIFVLAISWCLWRFFWDRQKLLSYSNKYFPDDAPYALLIGGYKYIMIRTPEDIKAVWNDTKSLSFDDYLAAVTKGFGVPAAHYVLASKNDPAKLWKGDLKETPFFVKDNPAKKRLVSLQEGWIKEALHPGEKMDTVSKIFLGNIEQLIPTYLSDPRVIVGSSESGDGQIFSLYKWGRYVLADAGSKAFLGQEIFGIDPDFVQHYIDWENLSWKIPYQRPGFLSRDVRAAEEVLVQTFMKYYFLDSAERPNLSWLFNRMQSEQRHLGLTLHDAGATALIMLWGIHLNTYRMLFWTLTHILSSPSLTETIREETSSAFDTDTNTFLTTGLMNDCPVLIATWNEVLRLYASSAVVRTCVSPTVISNKTVHVGDRILGQFRPMHLSTSIWGDDAHEFDERRWLKGGGIKNPRGFFPFGGGYMHCPGRTLAKQEVFLFVATVLRKYEIEPVGERVIRFRKGRGGEGERRWKVPGTSDKHILATLDPKEDFLVKIKDKKV
ncbi:cytochrome P450 [Rhexocercosporidium sp. MPI-PUGE-AT-0058]|nr:cytochrome P450 [Rhexocercosporidium sp. MPI-PUGE-AT-0058]